MNDKIPRHPFEELLIPRKELPKLGARYRVYKSAKEYITVEANSALEAFKNCGLQQVHRIERDAIYLTNVLDLQALMNNAPPTAPAPQEMAVVPDATVVAAEQETVAVASEEPAQLSTADVDKLLQGENATGA